MRSGPSDAPAGARAGAPAAARRAMAARVGTAKRRTLPSAHAAASSPSRVSTALEPAGKPVVAPALLAPAPAPAPVPASASARGASGAAAEGSGGAAGGTSAAFPAGLHARSSTPPPECISSAQHTAGVLAAPSAEPSVPSAPSAPSAAPSAESSSEPAGGEVALRREEEEACRRRLSCGRSASCHSWMALGPESGRSSAASTCVPTARCCDRRAPRRGSHATACTAAPALARCAVLPSPWSTCTARHAATSSGASVAAAAAAAAAVGARPLAGFGVCCRATCSSREAAAAVGAEPEPSTRMAAAWGT
eukprot:scaffold60327_cov60-Phaeocystis_antarctica.AAC.6